MANQRMHLIQKCLNQFKRLRSLVMVRQDLYKCFKRNETDAHTVVQYLVMKDATIGLEKLWEKDRLDLAMEEIMIKKEYQELFPSEIIKKCTDTL